MRLGAWTRLGGVPRTLHKLCLLEVGGWAGPSLTTSPSRKFSWGFQGVL